MRKNSVYMIILLFALAATGFYYYLQYARMRPDRYNWNRTFSDGAHEPYDFGAFRDLLKHSTKGKFTELRTREKHLTSYYSGGNTYLFAGSNCFLSHAGVDTLFTFASYGNNVLWITEGLPDTLLEVLGTLRTSPVLRRIDEPEVSVALSVPDHDYRFRFAFRTFRKQSGSCPWYHIEMEDRGIMGMKGEKPDHVYPMGTVNGRMNFAKFEYGAGAIYIHTSPVLFTNYALRTDSGFLYASQVLDKLTNGDVYYDAGAREPMPEAAPVSRKSDAPLSYILSKPALKTAWYIFLMTGLIFIVFRARRIQRIVPVNPGKRNTSLAFINSLSELYELKADHASVAGIIMQQLNTFVRMEFGVHTEAQDRNLYAQIARRSGVPVKDIERIYNYYEQVFTNMPVRNGQDALLEFYARVRDFYDLYEENKQSIWKKKTHREPAGE